MQEQAFLAYLLRRWNLHPLFITRAQQLKAAPLLLCAATNEDNSECSYVLCHDYSDDGEQPVICSARYCVKGWPCMRGLHLLTNDRDCATGKGLALELVDGVKGRVLV
jgi:hypothetical protein